LDEKRNLGQHDANISEGDKEWMKLRHQKSREYREHKQSTKYIELQEKFLEIKETSSNEYVEKKVEELKHSTL
jgi:hypothetical protein